MDKDKLYEKACEDYNSAKFSDCAKKINKLYKKHKFFDAALTSFCCYKLAENDAEDESLEKCLSILINEEPNLNESQKKILQLLKEQKDESLEIVIDDPKKLQKFKIVNAYYDESSSGIGDFLRGVCYLHKILSHNKIDFEIDFTKHSIGNFIKSNSSCKIKKIFDTERHNKGEAEFYFSNMRDNVNNILNNLPKTNKWSIRKSVITMFSNYSNFVFLSPEDKLNFQIDQQTKQFVKSNLIFKSKVEKNYNDLVDAGLKDYVVAHFRLGDINILKDNDIPLQALNDNINTKDFKVDYDECLDEVVKIIIDSKKTVVLLSDCNSLKEYIKDNIPKRYAGRLKTIHLDSFHTSSNPGFLDNIVPNHKFKKDKMFYVALDLKICTQAKHIYTHSVYPWGSGFTFWISKVYDIPLTCEKINE